MNAASINVAPGYPLSSIKKPASTIIIGDTGYEDQTLAGSTNISPSAGWAMLDADPRKANADTFGQPGLYPQFRHHMTKTKNNSTGYKVPIEGRANFTFLDGHAKSLDVATAFQSATTEDGQTLRTEPTGNPANTYPDIEYVLWNIY